MTVAPYRVHKLIQDLMRDPARAAAFAQDPEPAFDAFGLAEPEKALLRDGSPPALHALGVHPNLQMKYARLRAKPPPAGAAPGGGGPLAAYLDRLTRA
jgi:2'-aminobiphenyl-2,3-diol 1,2-dioxygenase small subunit